VTRAARGASGAAGRPALSVTAVTKRYGRTRALDAVSFAVAPGEAVALWGPNGAGKTTLLKALLGLIAVDGRLEVAGVDVRRAGKLARRHIGYVPQEAVYYDWSVAATLDFYARLKQVDRARIPALLARLGLSEHANKPVPALSGGLKQRLALAIALLADPPVLLLDEPTASLDAQGRRDYLALLAGLHHEGKTIVFASHRPEEIQALADRVLLLERGRLVESLSARELAARLAGEVELTMWVPDAAQRAGSLEHLARAGLAGHLNGQGTVVVRVAAGRKMQALEALRAEGVIVSDFSVEAI
jgi:ABC-type multidrug transport system ATPase subunit